MKEAIFLYFFSAVLLVSVFFIYQKRKKHSKNPQLYKIQAKFKNTKANSITCLLCGIFLMGLFVFLGYKTNQKLQHNFLIGIIIGAFICLTSIAALLFNFKAYLYVDNGCIKGKYHWFGKIDCNITDVDFVLGQGNSLTIQLNNGKRHTIMGIENAFSLSSAIRQNMSFETTEQPIVLIENLNALKSAKKQGVINVCLCLVLMFINIFVTVFLTGERDLHEFSKTDWIIFIIS